MPIWVQPGQYSYYRLNPGNKAGPRIKSGVTEAEHPLKVSESDQPALLHRRFDEAGKQRVRVEGLGLEFRVELHADKPGVIGPLDDFRERAVWGHA